MGLLEEMQRRNVHADVYSHSAAISACQKGNESGRALEIFSQMKLNLIQPNTITFNNTISACAKGGQ